MGRFKNLFLFLEENSIDTEYYLNEDARELYNKGELDLRGIEKLSVAEYASYLDLAKILKEEEV